MKEGHEQKVIDRIMKLIRLSEHNPNIEEASAAAAKVEELLTQYNMNLHDLPDGDEQKKVGLEIGQTVINLMNIREVKWQRELLQTIAHASFCEAYLYRHMKKRMLIVGTNTNRQAVVELFSRIAPYIHHMMDIRRTRQGKTDFLHGAVHGFGRQLKEHRESQRRDGLRHPQAIVLMSEQNQKSIKAFVNESYKVESSKGRTSFNAQTRSFYEGYQVGYTLPIDEPKNLKRGN